MLPVRAFTRLPEMIGDLRTALAVKIKAEPILMSPLMVLAQNRLIR